MKLVSLEMLQYFKTKLDALFVKKELKTGSDTEYRVLSDNNLTDELVTKINEAGSATAVTESIANAKSEAIAESKSYADEQVGAAKTELNSAIATATTDMATKTWTAEQIETATDDMATKTWASEQISTATTDMATNASVDGKIAEAKAYADTAESDAVATAKTYTDEQVAAAKTASNTYADEQVAAAKTALQTEIGTAKTEAVSESKTYTDNQVSAAKTELTTTINTKISTAYKIKGSTTFANLPALSADIEGNVYNVTDAFSTNDSFVEGVNKKYPAGSNVVCIEESEGVFKWDVLAGFIDTDTFVKVSDIEVVTEAEVDAMFAA